MDLKLGPSSRQRILPRTEESLRMVMEQAPKAEAMAARCVESTRPVWSWLVVEWRRLGTAAAVVLTAVLFLHVMFGANGMVAYRQKRDEYRVLQEEAARLQKENDRYVETVKALKTDPRAIEKEAREQLHYTRPGEIVYVAPEPPPPPPTGSAQNGK